MSVFTRWILFSPITSVGTRASLNPGFHLLLGRAEIKTQVSLMPKHGS